MVIVVCIARLWTVVKAGYLSRLIASGGDIRLIYAARGSIGAGGLVPKALYPPVSNENIQLESYGPSY